MRTWSLHAGDPIATRLAADARGGGTNPFCDLVWDLALRGGDPPSLALSSGYGQPGREVRIFPSFRLGSANVMDPGRFASPPIITAFLPSYVRIEAQPFPELGLVMECWVPRSDTAEARFQLTNRTAETLPIELAIFSSLRGGPGVKPWAAAQRGGAKILEGRVDGLAPVLFLAGSAEFESSPYPGLAVGAELEPAASRRWTWVHSATADPAESFALARETAARAWDAGIARMERMNAGTVNVETGDPEWDAVLAQAQTSALGAFVGSVRSHPHPVFVSARRPDRGMSTRGDGKDFDPEWASQSVWGAWSLARHLAWSAPDLARGVIRNLLASQDGRGHVDFGPDLSGRRDGTLCPPLLASLCLWIFEHTGDRTFLEEVLPRLVEFAEVWTGPEHDRDADGWPEWETSLQASLRNVPTFVPWLSAGAGPTAGVGPDLRMVETVDLASYLHRELVSLKRMAEILDLQGGQSALEGSRLKVQSEVERMWVEARSLYAHRDRDTHLSPGGIPLAKKSGPGEFRIRRRLPEPSRILVICRVSEGATRRMEIQVKGRDPDGVPQEESLGGDRFRGFTDSGSAVTRAVFSQVDEVEIRGVGREIQVEVRSMDLSSEDAGQMLPLWGGVPGEDRRQEIIRSALLDPDRFWRSFGIPASSAADPAYRPAGGEIGLGSMVWNAMLGEALVSAGHRAEAADLVGRLMAGAIRTLRARGEWTEFLDPEDGVGAGMGGHIAGIFPIALFLHVLGIRLITARQVIVEGVNPYPWPVEVRWKGLVVRREAASTRITFPDGGETVIPSEPGRTLVQQERDSQD